MYFLSFKSTSLYILILKKEKTGGYMTLYCVFFIAVSVLFAKFVKWIYRLQDQKSILTYSGSEHWLLAAVWDLTDPEQTPTVA